MSVLEWKNVTLFDLNSYPLKKIQHNTEITAYCFNVFKNTNGIIGTTLVLCDKSGYVHIAVNNGVKSKQISFLYCNGNQPIKLCALTTTNILTILGQSGNSLSIHIYDVNMITKEVHPCMSAAVFPAASMVSFLQVEIIGSEKLFALGIGFDKGDMLLYIGNINRDLSASIRRHSLASSSIIGIQFGTSASDLKTYEVFVMCVDRVYFLTLNDKNTIDSKILLDSEKQASNQCCTLSQYLILDSFLAVGRFDAIYCFRRDCRGPCYVIEGQKQFLSWIKNLLLVVVKTNFGAVISVVDVDLKIIVLHKQTSNVLSIVNFNDAFYILTEGKTSNDESIYNVYYLEEHKINIKLRTLLSKCMYDTAITMLKREVDSETDSMTYVRLKYGNNLMSKSCHARAVTEYIQTIGVVKSYDIIAKLLNSRHNKHLIEYLKNFLESKYATTEHQKLFVTCNDRETLHQTIDQLWLARNEISHVCDIKQIPSNNFTLAYLHLVEENEIFNFFLEHGRELLSADSRIVLNTFETLIKSNKIKNILQFIIFSEYLEFNANLLSCFIENNPSVDGKLYYHQLSIYLALWRERKVSTQFVEELLKNMPLRFDKKMILSKMYLFGTRLKDVALFKSHESELITEEDKKFLQCLQYHTNKDSASVHKMDIRLMPSIFEKLCDASDIQIKDIKQFLIEKFSQNALESEYEHKSIADLNHIIAINSSLESHYIFNPIEFRQRNCDICRQLLNLPSVYYLCQHSFHKDCLRINYNTKEGDIGCALCNLNRNYVIPEQKKIDLSSKSCDVIQEISRIFSSGMSHSLISDKPTTTNHNKTIVSQNRTIESSSNPFDDGYNSHQ